ncbi:MAG: DUF4845 domain-containing protein [Luminiphilus sp.]|nr:DUF4845 domain-containing protein [Luminiphilus sp.]
MQTKHWARRSISGGTGAAGFNVWTVSINLFLLSMILLIALRVVPSYMDYLTVKDLIARVAAEHNRQTDTVTDLRMRLGKLLTTNQIYDTRIEDIAIYRERGVIVIDASYEKRFPLFWILDGVIVFDDLVAETASMSRT